MVGSESSSLIGTHLLNAHGLELRKDFRVFIGYELSVKLVAPRAFAKHMTEEALSTKVYMETSLAMERINFVGARASDPMLAAHVCTERGST